MLPPNSLVLDAGAGEAQYRPDVARAGHQYRAIDLGVGEGDWNYGKIDAWARVEALPFPPHTFDGMLSVAVLEHTPFPRQTLHEMARALKPGGQLMIIVPTMWEEHQMPHDYYRFTRYGAQNLLEEAGFAVDQIRPLGGYFWFMGRKFIDVLEFFERFPRALLWPFLAIPFGFLLPMLCTPLGLAGSRQILHHRPALLLPPRPRARHSGRRRHPALKSCQSPTPNPKTGQVDVANSSIFSTRTLVEELRRSPAMPKLQHMREILSGPSDRRRSRTQGQRGLESRAP